MRISQTCKHHLFPYFAQKKRRKKLIEYIEICVVFTREWLSSYGNDILGQ